MVKPRLVEAYETKFLERGFLDPDGPLLAAYQVLED